MSNLEKLFSLFPNKHQVRRYINFIKSRQKREPTKAKGFHLHHIRPVSLGGTNEESNLIRLTIREHYIAHFILWKCGTEPMAKALLFMTNSDDLLHLKSSRSFERLCLEGYNYGMIWIHKNEIEKIISKEDFEAYREDGWFKGRKEGLETGRNMSGSLNPMYGKTHTDKAREKLSLSAAEYCKNSRWMNDGIDDQFVHSTKQNEYLIKGYTFGRINQKPTTKGKISIIKDETVKLINKEELELYLQDGYKIGSYTKSNRQKELISNYQRDTIWITNGIANSKIKKTEELPIGWTRGRTYKRKKNISRV